MRFKNKRFHHQIFNVRKFHKTVLGSFLKDESVVKLPVHESLIEQPASSKAGLSFLVSPVTALLAPHLMAQRRNRGGLTMLPRFAQKTTPTTAGRRLGSGLKYFGRCELCISCTDDTSNCGCFYLLPSVSHHCKTYGFISNPLNSESAYPNPHRVPQVSESFL